MRTRHRNRSHEITFDVRLKGTIQRFYGGTGAPAVLRAQAAQSGFSCLTSQAPLPARFLEPQGTSGGNTSVTTGPS